MKINGQCKSIDERMGKGSMTHWISAADKLVAIQDGKYVYCGLEFIEDRKPTRDHVVPIYRGGTGNNDNLVAACSPCNTSKGSKLLSEWMPDMAELLDPIVLGLV